MKKITLENRFQYPFLKSNNYTEVLSVKRLPGASVVKNLPTMQATQDAGSFPAWGRSPGGENGDPLQDSCLQNPMDRGDWLARVHGVAKSWTRLSD